MLSWTLKNVPDAPLYWSVQTIDTSMAASEWAPEQAYIKLSMAKLAADANIQVYGVITAVFNDVFYLEQTNRISGIRVEKALHGLARGDMATVSGRLQTNENGELYIAATSAAKVGIGSILPLSMNNKWLGGGPLGLQNGVYGWKLSEDINGNWQRIWGPVIGLNNIGLLVKTWGRIEISKNTTTSIIIDDGSEIGIKCILPADVTIDPAWDCVNVIGICSCEKVEVDGHYELHPVILVRYKEDICPL